MEIYFYELNTSSFWLSTDRVLSLLLYWAKTGVSVYKPGVLAKASAGNEK